MNRLLVLLITLVMGMSELSAQELTAVKVGRGKNPWIPNSALTQHGAYAGYVAAGFGYEWLDTLAVDLLYGYTPPEIAGDTVHSWSLKNVVYPFAVGRREFVRARPYMGLSINYCPDAGMFVRLPDQYPRGYYPPSALRYALLGGIEMQVQSRLAVAVEFAVLDTELSYFDNAKRFDPKYMGSSGFSVRWLL